MGQKTLGNWQEKSTGQFGVKVQFNSSDIECDITVGAGVVTVQVQQHLSVMLAVVRGTTNCKLFHLCSSGYWVDSLLFKAWGLLSGKQVATSSLRWEKQMAILSLRSVFEHFDRLLLFMVVAAQIWDHHGLRKCLNLTALNKHGRVYDDGETHVSCFYTRFFFFPIQCYWIFIQLH